jgi:hypothetical protein
MKLDWHYITEETAQRNLNEIAVDCISKTVFRSTADDANSIHIVRGIMMMLDATKRSLEEKKDE